ncbi:hydroxymethylbilane synthase [Chloroflexota bacterium]
MTQDHIIIGSRGSDLALWQANYVADLLRVVYIETTVTIEIFTTRGDKVLDTPLPLIGGKGLFTAELEAALYEGRIDLAVHSLKDLPTDDPDGLIIGAIPARADVNDVLVCRGDQTLATLPSQAVIGTSSTRRAAQLLAQRSDLKIEDIRGNVPTRAGRVQDPVSVYDATVLAKAGVDRLGMQHIISEVLSLDLMLPAPGQGALGIQCRADATSQTLVTPLDDHATRLAVTAERAFLAGLGGGCSVPVAAYATVNGALHLQGRVAAVTGDEQVNVSGQTAILTLEAAYQLGQTLAEQAKQQGATAILEAVHG